LDRETTGGESLAKRGPSEAQLQAGGGTLLVWLVSQLPDQYAWKQPLLIVAPATSALLARGYAWVSSAIVREVRIRREIRRMRECIRKLEEMKEEAVRGSEPEDHLKVYDDDIWDQKRRLANLYKKQSRAV
jgi:hypothetical protein